MLAFTREDVFKDLKVYLRWNKPSWRLVQGCLAFDFRCI